MSETERTRQREHDAMLSWHPGFSRATAMRDSDMEAIKERFKELMWELSRIKARQIISLAETTEIIGRALEELKIRSELILAEYLPARDDRWKP
jgi:hypothetical protein